MRPPGLAHDNGINPLETGANRKRIRWILIVLVLQLALLWFLSDRTPPTPRTDPHQSVFALVTDREAAQQLAVGLGPQDPLLFASASPKGFSGTAWLQPRQMKFEAEDWREPPYWLDRTPEASESLIHPQWQNEIAPNYAGITKPPPRMDRAPEVPQTILPQSTMRAQGALASRVLLKSNPLPIWTNSSPLRATTVEIVVNAEGEPFSARLLSTNGLATADQQALMLAKAVRFAPETPSSTARPDPDRNSNLMLGLLIFDWATVAPPASPTNQKASP